MKWLLIVCLFSLSCAQAPKKAAFLKVEVFISEADVEACIDYQKTVLDPSFAIKKDVLVFTPDQKIARRALSSFDIEKGLVKPKAQMVENILNQCDSDLIKKFDSEFNRAGKCSVMIAEWNFFQGLAQALNKYPWPTDLKLEGKKVALDYVRYFSEGQFSLLNRLIALSVLDELSVNKVVNEGLHPEIKKLMNESQVYVEGLRSKLSKDPKLTCDSLTIIRDELIYSEKVGKKILEFLTRI